ncbi:MAG: hypothetical protein QXY83_05955, partial [Thermosphaera sp.]
VVRRSVYLDFYQHSSMSFMGGFEDWEWWIRMLSHGWLSVVIPKYYFYYRDRRGSMLHLINTNKNLLLRQQIVQLNKDVYNFYADKLFCLCDQNEIAPIYWLGPASRYELDIMAEE